MTISSSLVGTTLDFKRDVLCLSSFDIIVSNIINLNINIIAVHAIHAVMQSKIPEF